MDGFYRQIFEQLKKDSYEKCPLQELEGKVITKIEYMLPRSGMKFYCHDFSVYEIYCNPVRGIMYLDEMRGNLEWLINSPILSAEQWVSKTVECVEDENPRPYYITWTYDRFSIRKGTVDMRFIGQDCIGGVSPYFIRLSND